MKKKLAYLGLCFFLILASAFDFFHVNDTSAASQTNEKTQVLYDAASGVVPSAPLLNFAAFPPGAAQPAYANGATVLDTSVSGRHAYAGWTAYGSATPGFPRLDRASGFQVDFTLQVEDESHRTNNRSGFNLIVLDQDARGIELAFWKDEIWAQSDSSTGGLFRHGEGASFQTATGLVDYRLVITGDTYTLTANTQPILSGPIRDYSAFEGFPDPYQTPHFLFLGDNTASAQARIRLDFVSVTGTEVLTPAVTSAGASTAVPLATASPQPPSPATPNAIPVPTERADELCPGSGFLLVVLVTIPRMLWFIKAGPARERPGIDFHWPGRILARLSPFTCAPTHTHFRLIPLVNAHQEYNLVL